MACAGSCSAPGGKETAAAMRLAYNARAPITHCPDILRMFRPKQRAKSCRAPLCLGTPCACLKSQSHPGRCYTKHNSAPRPQSSSPSSVHGACCQQRGNLHLGCAGKSPQNNTSGGLCLKPESHLIRPLLRHRASPWGQSAGPIAGCAASSAAGAGACRLPTGLPTAG